MLGNVLQVVHGSIFRSCIVGRNGKLHCRWVARAPWHGGLPTNAAQNYGRQATCEGPCATGHGPRSLGPTGHLLYGLWPPATGVSHHSSSITSFYHGKLSLHIHAMHAFARAHTCARMYACAHKRACACACAHCSYQSVQVQCYNPMSEA